MKSNEAQVETMSSQAVTEVSFSPEEALHGKEGKEKRLGVWSATAICWNDITSSCLYVSSIRAFE